MLIELVWVNDAVGYRCPECSLFVCKPKRKGSLYCVRCTD